MIKALDFGEIIEFLKICRAGGPLTGADVKAAVSKQTGKIFCRVFFNKDTNEIERWFSPECTLDETVVAEQRIAYFQIDEILQDLWPEGFTRTDN